MKILRIGNQFYLHEVELKEKLDDVFKTATKGSTHQALRSILALRDEEVNSLWENCSKVVDKNGEPLMNDRSGFVAVINKPQRKELTIINKVKMSAQNGFSKNAHYGAVNRIEKLFKYAIPSGEYPDLKHGDDKVKIRRFACPIMIKGEKAVAWLTAKQTTNVEGRERLYNLELVDIEMLAGTLEYLSSHRLDTELPSASKDIMAEIMDSYKTYFGESNFSLEEAKGLGLIENGVA